MRREGPRGVIGGGSNDPESRRLPSRRRMPVLAPSALMSIVVSYLVCVGYAPELVRLWREWSATASSLPLWVIWASSPLPSATSAAISLAPFFVIANISLVCALTCVALVGSCSFALWLRQTSNIECAEVAVLPSPVEAWSGGRSLDVGRMECCPEG